MVKIITRGSSIIPKIIAASELMWGKLSYPTNGAKIPLRTDTAKSTVYILFRTVSS